MKSIIAGAMLLLATTSANAQIVAGGTVEGFGTFVDANTGRTWLRLDNFFNTTGDQMVSAAEGAGFQFATASDVSTLFASLTPITPDGWQNDAAIMGRAPARNIIWGAFAGPVDGSVGWGWAADWDSNWNMILYADSIYDTPNGGGDFADMNVWAYMNPPRNQGAPTAVPEPMTWALMLGGFGLVGATMRHKRIAVSFA